MKDLDVLIVAVALSAEAGVKLGLGVEVFEIAVTVVGSVTGVVLDKPLVCTTFSCWPLILPLHPLSVVNCCWPFKLLGVVGGVKGAPFIR